MRLKNKNISCLLALALSAGLATANADSLSGNGTWNSWNTGGLVVDGSSSGIGTPYWNNASGDGPKDNVGWCLTGGGGCTMPAGTPGALSYYGNGSAAASSMYFNATGNPITVTLETLMTTQKSTASGYNIFGYYLAGTSGQAPSVSSLNPLFDSRTSTVGTAVTVSSLAAGDTYGFYIENIQGGGTQYQANYYYFMDSASNMATGSMPADSLQHFAAFDALNGNYFLGDANADSCQNGFQPGTSPCVVATAFDYNDMMVELGTSNAPEPASLTLIGGGLLLLGTVTRRKLRHSAEN